MFIDTHCHLHDREFFSEEAAAKALDAARENGVEKVICIGTNVADSWAAREFATASGQKGIFWTFGVHPEFATEVGAGVLAGIDMALIDSAVGVGEIGLDYHYAPETRTEQIRLLEEMLQLAQDKNLPVSFHVREAFDDFFPVVRNFPKIRGVVHSFSDSKKNLRRVLGETDFYVGVNGMATYSTLPTPPLERILLETDAPFLAPIPHRGETNEPAYIKDIAAWLTQKLGVSEKEVAEATTQNAEKLFGI